MNYESTKDTAKKIRTKLKKEFAHLGLKANHFSVKSNKYSSIDISWEDYPVKEDVEKIVYQYKGKYFDGMIDLEENTGYTDPDTGEHVDGFSYIYASYHMSEKRRKLIENNLRKEFPSFDSYDASEREHLIRKNNVKYDIDGFIKPEYEIKELSEDFLNETLDKILNDNLKNIKLSIPDQYFNEVHPTISIKNRKIFFGSDENLVKQQIKEYILRDVNTEYIKTENDYISAVKSRIDNIHYKDIPYFEELHDNYIKYLDDIATKNIAKYMDTRNVTDVFQIYKTMYDSIYDNFGDFISLEIVSVAGAFKDWNGLVGHGIIKLYKYLDENLDLEDLSPQSDKNIKKLISEAREDLKYINFNYEDYPISTNAIYLFDNHFNAGTYCIYDDNSQNGNNKKIHINTTYSSFASIIRKEESESIKDARDGIFNNKTNNEIKEQINKNIKIEILNYLVSRTDFILNSRLESLLDILLRMWISDKNIDPAKLNNLPELQDVTIFNKANIKNELYSGVNPKLFIQKIFKIFNDIYTNNNDLQTIESLKIKILEKEFQSLKDNRELYIRMSKILKKQVSFDGNLLDLMKSSKYFNNFNNILGYLEYRTETYSIIILPYACYMISKSNKTSNNIAQVIYSIKSNTLQECEQNYMKAFSKKANEKDIKEFLNLGYIIVKNMSLR